MVLLLFSTIYQIQEYFDTIYPQVNCVIGDYPIWLFIAAKNKIKFLNEVSSVYRYSKGSISRPKSREKMYNYIMAENKVRLFYLSRYHELLLPKEKESIINHEIDRLISKSIFCEDMAIFEQALILNAEHHKNSICNKWLGFMSYYMRLFALKTQKVLAAIKSHYVKDSKNINE